MAPYEPIVACEISIEVHGAYSAVRRRPRSLWSVTLSS